MPRSITAESFHCKRDDSTQLESVLAAAPFNSHFPYIAVTLLCADIALIFTVYGCFMVNTKQGCTISNLVKLLIYLINSAVIKKRSKKPQIIVFFKTHW